MRPDLPNRSLRDPHQWDDFIESDPKLQGALDIGDTPRLGAIAVFEGNYCPTCGIGSHGHVGYVTDFTASEVTVSEMSCGGGCANYPKETTYPILSGEISFIYAAPTLFEHSNFQGDWRHFETDFENFEGQDFKYSEDDNVCPLNDNASSLWMPYPYSASINTLVHGIRVRRCWTGLWTGTMIRCGSIHGGLTLAVSR